MRGPMFAKPEPACLVIADITGYTGYLAGAELDHAQDVLADLMDTVVTNLHPLFRLAKLEGDAAFCYAIADVVDGNQLQDTIERCYFAFRRRLRDIQSASSCDCNACILIPALDLKLIVHHGLVGRQRIAGSEELVGSEVILVHRLLKNSVAESLGISAYALYTGAVVGAIGLVDPDRAGLVHHVENYDVIGDVECWVRDLAAAWIDELEATRVRVADGSAVFTVEADLPGPPEIVWEWVTSPVRRPTWQAGVTAVETDAEGGRYGIGATNHCIHGKEAIVEEILDWRPFEYVTDRTQLPDPSVPPFLMTYTFEPIELGTRVRLLVGRPSAPDELAVLETLRPEFEHVIAVGLAALGPLVAEDVAARAAQAATQAPEPELPTSGGRHLPDPVDSALARSS
jgi:hypothetical protein